MSQFQDSNNDSRSLWSMLSSMPHAAGELFSGWAAAWLACAELRRSRRDITWNEGAARSILCQLDKTAEGCQRKRTGFRLHPDGVASRISGTAPPEPLSATDRQIVKEIQETLEIANRSNISRTEAYFTIYEEYPEIHWAFLAHLVSRNAGWNMTDLKSGLMSDLTSTMFKERMYQFLERCNALIFQDAYPQLLLYKHSRRIGRSCFHLLPQFHISAFMTPFWERFWMDRSSSLLTVGLIINEQNYIEGRVVSHPYFQENVLQEPQLKMHEFSRLNQVIVPLGSSQCRHDLFKESILPLRPLMGLTISHFSDLSERIRAGKTLYAMLFGYETVYEGALEFARCTPHYGSREEYWPALFTSTREQALREPDESDKLLEQEWLPQDSRLYSPRLKHVWQDTDYEPIPRYDWFQDARMLQHLTKPVRPFLFDMTHAHRSAMERIAFAHDAEEAARPGP